MTLVLSEANVESLLDMGEVVNAVEEAFSKEAKGEAVNSARTRSRSEGAQLNVMHANLSYLGRGGVKCYMSSPAGTRFVFVLFDLKDSSPLCVMGAENLGRYRTGAASGVATKYLYPETSCAMAIMGSGRQAITQVMAVAIVKKVERVNVWSPNREHQGRFAEQLSRAGFQAHPKDSPGEALKDAQVATSITSAKTPFIDADSISGVSHLNVCGGNNPEHAEIFASAIGVFETIAVDDITQGRVEYGDLIQAEKAGKFSWNDATELKDFVSGKARPRGRTLFKSGGAALEDVAVANLVYEKARKDGKLGDRDWNLS